MPCRLLMLVLISAIHDAAQLSKPSMGLVEMYAGHATSGGAIPERYGVSFDTRLLHSFEPLEGPVKLATSLAG